MLRRNFCPLNNSMTLGRAAAATSGYTFVYHVPGQDGLLAGALGYKSIATVELRWRQCREAQYRPGVADRRE